MGSEQVRTIAHRGRQLTAIAVSAALAAGTLAVAWPAVAAGPTYYGCLTLANGYLYDVSTSPQDCGIHQRISWNQRGAKGPQGPKGKQGRRGKQGKDGKDGQDGAKGDIGPRGLEGPALELVTYAVSASTSGEAGRLMTATATCDEGDIATGGGFDTDGQILASLGVGSPSPTGWQAIATASTEDASTLTVQVVCADLGAARRALDE